MDAKEFEASFREWLDEISSDTAPAVPVVRQPLIDFATRTDEMETMTNPLEEDEAVQQARKEIVGKIANHRPKVPRGLDRSWKWEGRIAGLATGSLAGAKLGAGFGIATAGWGMGATIPGAIFGGLIGVLVGDKLGGGLEKPPRGFVPDIARLGGDGSGSSIPKLKNPLPKKIP